ncbi:MAG: acyl-CoA thioesterase-2 [Candidatus Pseudothioglobus sp.]
MHPKLAALVQRLDLERIEDNIFRGYHPPKETGRLYGGQIMAQALIAAGRTVPEDRPPHSLHGYFLRPGDPSVPVLFEVERIRDGRSFSTRRIVVIQRGKAIFSMDVSFQVVEAGLAHQAVMPDVARPDDATLARTNQNVHFLTFLMEYKAKLARQPLPPAQHHWFCANGDIPSSDPLLHAALLTFQSDGALLSTSRLPHADKFERKDMQSASLDHAMWFHSPAVRVDQWILYALDAPRSAAARGYNRGMMFTESGELVASTMQESLMRLRKNP